MTDGSCVTYRPKLIGSCTSLILLPVINMEFYQNISDSLHSISTQQVEMAFQLLRHSVMLAFTSINNSNYQSLHLHTLLFIALYHFIFIQISFHKQLMVQVGKIQVYLSRCLFLVSQLRVFSNNSTDSSRIDSLGDICK